jgi:hypothetical protein
MVALHPTTTADVDTRKHMDLHLCDSSRGSWMHIPFCRLAHALTTLGIGYKVNTVMEVLILSQWKMLRSSLSSVKVQMVSQ